MNQDAVVQKFLDATRNPQVFCQGRIISLLFNDGTARPTPEPNCGMIADCPLFRSPHGRPIVLWTPGAGTPDGGCDAYRALRRWNRSQQYWIVQFEGHPEQEVQAADAQLAACTVWLDSLKSMVPISKWLLFGERYTVREA